MEVEQSLRAATTSRNTKSHQSIRTPQMTVTHRAKNKKTEPDTSIATLNYKSPGHSPILSPGNSLSRKENPAVSQKRSTKHGLLSRDSLTIADGTMGRPSSESHESVDEESDKFAGFQRFKTLANKLKNQIVWKKGLQRAEEHLKMYVVPGGEGGQNETMTFNVNAFKPEIQSWEGLSPKAKAILVKPSWMRTEDELKFLHRFTIRLKCFDRYPMYVRKELARVLYYESFEKGRVVIRQGDIGFNFYFILSGSVLVEMQETDQRTGKKINMIVGELSSGAAFGELALLHDDRRRATIVCKEYSEFLKVDKPDFDEVLKKNHEKEWKERMNYFKEHSLFKGWTPAGLHYAVEISQMREYLPNSVILKDLAIPSENIFFIVKGACKVVQKVYFWEYVETGHTSYYTQNSIKLPPLSIGIRNQNETDAIKHGNSIRQVKKWWVLQTLHPGDYFGVGEGDLGVSVIAHEKAELLLVNKMVFVKCGKGKCLIRMKNEAAKLYPSRKVALASYKETKRWREYKKQVVMDVVRSHKSSALWSPLSGATQ